MTAGHNAFRGPGPCHKLAFDDAMAQMGCPDHRIDPVLHYVLFALSNLLITPLPARSLYSRAPAGLSSQRDRFFVAFAFGHHRPSHARDLVRQRNVGNVY